MSTNRYRVLALAASIVALVASCAPIAPEDAKRLDAYQSVIQAKGASNALTLDNLEALGLARRVNLADPAFPHR